MDSRSDQMNDTFLKIFTLNIWGLKYVSRHREERVKLIAKHLAEHDYDVVFLQEVWVQSDFEWIRSATESKYKFVHMFKNASILGTSGLVVLVKWIPKVFHFHPFSVNGSPFRPFHGDWFTSKGIGYVRVELDSMNLHLFCTHMHAKYNIDERLGDQYSVHRICQSYEMSKFVDMMTTSKTSDKKDFVILAGDMNTSSKELPYHLLVGLTQCFDCYKIKTNSNGNGDIEGGDTLIRTNKSHSNDFESDLSDDEFHTCGHRDNTFTPRPDKGKVLQSSERIDFILFRLFDNRRNSFSGINESLSRNPCEVKLVTVHSKDDSGLSFSDHQPVVALFKIRCSDQKFVTKRVEVSVEQSKCITNGMVTNSSGKERDNYLHSRKLSNGGGSSDMHERQSCGNGTDNSLDSENICLLSGKPKLKLIILPEMASKSGKSGPLLLKTMPSNAVNSKLRFNPRFREQYLEVTKNLLEGYINDNQLTSKTFLMFFITFVLSLVLLVYSLYEFTNMTIIGIILSSFLFSIVCSFSAFLKLLSSRHEKNAIKAIVNDIEKSIQIKH